MADFCNFFRFTVFSFLVRVCSNQFPTEDKIVLNQKLKSKQRYITFSDFVEVFKRSVRNVHQKSTKNADDSKLNQLNQYFGEYDIAEIQHVDILEWMDYAEDVKRYKNKTLNEYFRLLRAVFNVALHNGNITKSPMFGIRNRILGEHDSAFPFTLKELRTFEKTVTAIESGKALCLVMSYSGLRTCEAIALRTSDVDLNNKTITVQHSMVMGELKCTKTVHSQRKIPINSSLHTILKEQLKRAANHGEVKLNRVGRDGKTRTQEKCVFLFTDQNGNHFRDVKDVTQKFWKKFIKDADQLHLKTYCESIEARGISQMRHTFASHALTAGVNKDWLAKVMGHADTEMIDKVYAKWIVEDAKDQTNILDLHFKKKAANTNGKDLFDEVA